MNPAGPASRASGLTLVELLIVLLIVSLGWFTLLPRLDPTRPGRAQQPVQAMNDFLAQVEDAAFVQGRLQPVRLDPRVGQLNWNDKSHDLPGPVSGCTINTRPCPHRDVLLRVFPGGYMDNLELRFSTGEHWISADLAVRMTSKARP